MRRIPEEEGKRWLRQAERDLDDARYAFKGKRYNLTCFLAQQAAEKALKGYLYAQGAELVMGHSVRELCVNAADFDEDFVQLGSEIAALDQYYIPTRYPNALPGGVPFEAYNAADGERALSLAEEALGIVRAKLGMG